jgi:hypothetical protein
MRAKRILHGRISAGGVSRRDLRRIFLAEDASVFQDARDVNVDYHYDRATDVDAHAQLRDLQEQRSQTRPGRSRQQLRRLGWNWHIGRG